MKKYNKQVIIENLKKYRKINNLTQEDLAEKLSYSVKAIASWEQGVVVPPLEVLIDFSSELNMKLEEFLGIKEESIFDYISQKTLEKFNYSLLDDIILYWKKMPGKFSQKDIDEGGFIINLNRLNQGVESIKEIIKSENRELIFDLTQVENTVFKLNYECLEKNIIFKMLCEEGLIKLEKNKVKFDSKISNYIIKAILDTKQFSCMKEYSGYIECFESEDDVPEIDPEIWEEMQKAEKEIEEEFYTILKENQKHLNNLFK